MKKLLFAAVVAAAMTGMADVSSANVVGYLTYTTQGGKMDLFGAPFINVGGTGCSIQNVKFGEGADQGGEDLMMIFNPNTQEWIIYNWCSELYDDQWQALGYPGWGDANWQEQKYTLDPGQGFWLQTKQDVTVTVPGQVSSAKDNTTTTVGGKMDVYTGIYPTALNIQDCKLTDGADQGGEDLMMVFVPETQGWTIYNWCAELYDDQWQALGYPGWGDANWQEQKRTLNPGQGFWLQTKQDCKVEFKSPL